MDSRLFACYNYNCMEVKNEIKMFGGSDYCAFTDLSQCWCRDWRLADSLVAS